jgi:hypothetical protein
MQYFIQLWLMKSFKLKAANDKLSRLNRLLTRVFKVYFVLSTDWIEKFIRTIRKLKVHLKRTLYFFCSIEDWIKQVELDFQRNPWELFSFVRSTYKDWRRLCYKILTCFGFYFIPQQFFTKETLKIYKSDVQNFSFPPTH